MSRRSRRKLRAASLTRTLSRVSPCSASTYGVGTPTMAPISRTAPVSESSSSDRPASASCSIEGRKSPSLRVTACRSSGTSAIGQPIRVPISRASSMAAEQNACTRSSSRTWPAVAPVIAQTGFMVRLPHSLYQTSACIRGETVTSNPASRSAPVSPASRAVSAPDGSPMMRPLPLCRQTTPGSRELALMCTVPPITWLAGMAAAITPPGSTLSRWRPAIGPPNPSKNHHGTPLSVDSTAAPSASSGPRPPTAAGRDCAFTAITTKSWGPSSAASSDAATLTVTVPSADSTLSPRDRIAASVAPRASTLTSVPPELTRPDAMTPPIAPAPTTQMRMRTTLTGGRLRAVVRFGPDAAVVHEPYLLIDHLAAVVGVVVRRPVEIQVLGVDGALVNQLVLLRGEVLEPVVPLRRRPEPAQRLHVDGAGHPGRPGAVGVPPDDLPAVVDDRRSASECVDRHVGVGMQVIGGDVAGDEVQVVVQGPCPVLDLEQAVAGVRVRVRPAVDDLCAVHGQSARVLRVRALVGHQETEPADRGVGHRVEGVQRAPVQGDPLVPHVVRGHRVLHGLQRHDLVVLQDDLAGRVEDEADVEEPTWELRVPGLRLAHHERVPLPGELAQVVGLRPGHVDRALTCERLVVQVENLVVEALQGAFRDGDEPDGKIKAGQPGSRLDQLRDVLEVDGDLIAVPDAPHGGNQADGLIGLDHDSSLRRCLLASPPCVQQQVEAVHGV